MKKGRKRQEPKALPNPVSRSGAESLQASDLQANQQTERYSIETGILQIENTEITTAQIPAENADWHTLSLFAYSFDGYTQGYSNAECGSIGNSLRELYQAGGVLSASLTELRIALFFEARRYHHFGWDPNAADMQYLHAVVNEIRKHVSK